MSSPLVDRAQYPGMVDAVERVTGRIGYAVDLVVPRMLHARLLRSAVPHALIRRLDVSRARALPGVAAVITGADLVAHPDVQPFFGPVFRDQPILAIDRVRYVGEPVVAVAAVDLDTAREALALVEVEYEPLPAVFDAEESTRPGAPILHEGPPRIGRTYADIIVAPGGPGSNVCNHFKLRKGDVERALRDADLVQEDVFTCPPAQPVPLETHVCVADVHAGGMTVWSAMQIPHAARATLAEVFPAYAGKIRVVTPPLGGGYGAKGYPKIEPVTAALSMVARRPVKLHLSREEEFVTVTKHGVRIRMTTGVTADGILVARKAICHFNTGAYADIGPRLVKNGGYGTGGPHNIPNVWVDSYAIYTNLPPAGAYRGYGINQAAWAYETQMDIIAERLGMDPLELRMKNLLSDGDAVMTGSRMEDSHFRDVLTNVADGIGWSFRGWGPGTETGARRVRGVGLSCIIKGTITPSTSTVLARLDEGGQLHVATSSVEMGQGLKTALAIIAAEHLGIDIGRVTVATPDTDTTPYDQVTGSSRSTYMMGGALELALDEIRDRVLELAGQQLEISPGDLELRAGAVHVRGVPGRSVTIADVVSRSRAGSVTGRGHAQTSGGLDPETGQGIASVHWHQAAGAAEVEVDLDTGKVEVLRYRAAVYAGRIINPVQCELQSEGNVAFGIGQALFEEMIFDGGQLQNGNLGDYMIAYPKDMPPDLEVAVLEDRNRNEIHGIGETGLPPVAPAIGNAVYRATGVRITDLPITPEKVLRALRDRSGSSSSSEPTAPR